MSRTHHGDDDAFGAPERIPESDAETWANALDVRAASPDQRALRAMAIEAGRVQPGQSLAEVGCGTGSLLCELASAVGARGRVTGIEPIAEFARRARARLARDGAGERATVLDCRVEAAALADLDACFAQTTFIHVPHDQQVAAVAHAAGWLRPGGLLVSLDQDGDTWTIDHSDRALTRRVVQYNTDLRYGDGWFGRRARGVMRLAGLREVTVRATTHVDTDPAGYLIGMARRIANAARQRHAITEPEHRGWLDEIEERARRDAFFSSITYFITVGTRAAG